MEGFHPEGTISRESLEALGVDGWPAFRKIVPIQAIRVAGPFTVQIDGQGPESVVTCDDGYLCVDARGYPYPVAAAEFEQIYAPLEPEVPAAETA